MYQIVYERLKEVASAGKTITYNKISKLINLDMKKGKDRKKLSDILGEISKKELEEERPLLSAVVVSYHNQSPGPGFFKMTQDLGVQEFNEKGETFYREELRRVHEYWKKNKK